MPTVLLVTGATGIAAETAVRASGYDCLPFIVGLEEDKCRALAETIPHSAWLTADLRVEGAAELAVQRCLEHYGRLDALFNVAGISGRRYGDGPLHECSVDGWTETMDSNVRTMFLMCRAALRHWLEALQPGTILNMASVVAVSPEPKYFATHAYAASKGAVLSLTKSLAAYYGPLGIRVNAIAPGLTATPMSERAQRNGEIMQFVRKKQPIAGGVLDAGDVADAALFLLTDVSRHVTGAVLTVDGGWSVS
jgi:NAD(P)-dependent dehydrogenase (short-subunit alcohol dehydrogenase family)